MAARAAAILERSDDRFGGFAGKVVDSEFRHRKGANGGNRHIDAGEEHYPVQAGSWTDLAGRAAGFVQSPDEGRLLQSRHLSCINTVAGNHGDSRPAGLWPVQYIGFHGGTARTRAPAIADAIPGLSQTPPGAARTTHLVTRLAFLPNRSALQWL